ncbi:MAG: efflux RND transporter periplasmic adaptor subunit [Chitinophagales bacterium]
MAKRSASKTVSIVFMILIPLIVIGAVIAKKQGFIDKKALIKVATDKAEKHTIIETVSASGKIYPELEIKITPDVSGEVVTLNIQEGDSVKAGQLLAKIDPEAYVSFVDRAEAAVKSAQSTLSNTKARSLQAKVQMDNAQRVYNRNKKLFEEELLSQAEYESAEAQYESAKAEYQAALKNIEGGEYNIESAEASFREAKDNLRKTNIYAPISGVVSRVSIEKGERVVGTSQFAGTEIIRIANFNDIEARVDVSENDILRVSLGDTALVEVDAYIDRKFKGVVTQIANSANLDSQISSDQITNFTVQIRLLPDSYTDLTQKFQFPFRPGMSASVDIQTHKISNTLAVPIQCVTAREIPDSLKTNMSKEEAEELQELVYVYADGKVISSKVTTGIQDENYIQILSGLTEGAEVVSAPYRTIAKKLEDDMKVDKVDKEDLFKKEDEE